MQLHQPRIIYNSPKEILSSTNRNSITLHTKNSNIRFSILKRCFSVLIVAIVVELEVVELEVVELEAVELEAVELEAVELEVVELEAEKLEDFPLDLDRLTDS